VASNLVRAAKKPPAPASPTRGGRAPGADGGRRHPITDDSARYGADWRSRYTRRLWVSDLITLTVVAFGTQIAWFGLGNAQVSIREDSRLSVVSYWFFSALLVVAWMWSLSLIDSRSDRAIGTGSTEYIRIISVSVRLFGIIAILAFLLRVDVARGYLLISFPLGILVLLLERWLWRQWLVRQRARGEFSARVLLVGSENSVAQISEALRRTPSAGYLVVGACVPQGVPGQNVRGTDIPIVGSVLSVSTALAAADADTVAISSTDDLPPSVVKRISWQLEAGRQHLVLAPSIIDVVGPRIQTRPVAGLPLIHVETPRYSKGQRLAKRGLDLLLATTALIVLSPIMAVIALRIRSAVDGPVLFRQVRVGLDGREFRLFKFRTMVQNAEELLADLEPRQDAGNEVLFKMSEDPRVTDLGRFLRRYSLDELPQLFNVIGGSMSLVGPRPSLPREVERYADHVHRRFMVKPGITGLWQISGRSTLSWEETVRLDLSYVENWTLIGDIVILFKTAKAALAPGDTAA
jgi:exopolysaccharide biosynthesis polyprenyl glycosylphosphotransferase